MVPNVHLILIVNHIQVMDFIVKMERVVVIVKGILMEKHAVTLLAVHSS